ncbi:MAG: calcium-translocating P-type ATPase, SERCA-type [Firmicutes bacterium]|nr:calcium-translocating P-type ATPase, SERCA-type [Bacillota bacterium]
MNNWFNLSAAQTVKALSTNIEHGLTAAEASRRLEEVGQNQLSAVRKISPWRIFADQFTDFMVLVLIGAALVSGFLGEQEDALTILAIIILNALLGFFQEYRAEKSLEALKELTSPLAHVWRDGKPQRIPAKELVPGDIIALESGDRVPADGRIVAAINLEINEATLTGESMAVAKTEEVLSQTNPVLGDQRNMVFAGTVVTSGRGKAVVCATGMKTEIGKIAGMISQTEDEATPLQKRLEQLGRWLVVICLGVCAMVGTLGVLRGEPPRQMFMAAVSLAVAAIPEGLPAIVTIALAVGVQKMIKRKAIVRKLPAVETLGCATVICSDKTGTLTQNKLTVTKIWAGGREYLLKPESSPRNGVKLSFDIKRLLEIGALCNNAYLEENHQKKGRYQITGEPTEAAIVAVAAGYGITAQGLAKRLRREGEIPFSSERKRMGVWVKEAQEGRLLMVKGAADVILERSVHFLKGQSVIELTPELKSQIKAEIDRWGAEALRVLAFAYRLVEPGEIKERDPGDPERDLIFTGLMGMTDPPRPESGQAVIKAKRAGIQVKMITGDYPRTAAAIGKQISLLRPEGKIITGVELDRLSDAELTRVIGEIDIFARVSPHHKLRVVKALKQNGEVVAMTGDGVNDAPAVKESDIGVAMGISGTDVTKEASSMIIADDNFATIVAAVEEGRIIYDNIRKFIRYLLSCNIGEILTMFGGILLGLPFPLLPIQMLWVNLVTDGLPAIALGMDPAEPGVMSRPPRPSREGIFSRGLGWKIVLQGLLIGLATLGVYLIQLRDGQGLVLARTTAFTTLVFAQLCFVFQCRSERHSFLKNNPFQNLYLVGAVMISTLMQLTVVYLPWFQKIFDTGSLTERDWFLILFAVVSVAFCGDLAFRFRRVIRKHLAYFHWNTNRAVKAVVK